MIDQDQEVRDIGVVEYRDEVMGRLRMRIIYLKASVKDSVDNDKGEEGDKPGHEGKKDHQDERVHLFLRLRSLGLVPYAPSSS